MVTICAERRSRNVRPHWRLLRGERECIAFNEHYSGDGAIAAQSRPPTALRAGTPAADRLGLLQGADWNGLRTG